MSSGPHPIGPAPWGMAASVAWLLAAFAASILVASGFYGVFAGDRPGAAAGYDGVIITVGTLSAFPVQVAVLAMAARLRRWPAADYLALNLPRREEIVLAAICVVALVAVFNTVLFASGQDIVPPFQVETYRSAKEAGWLPWLFVAVVVVAPVGEEIAFRGFLFRGFARPGYEVHAIAVIALAWALLHIQYDWLGMLQIFAIGFVLGWFRWASGSTTLAILMHVLINLESSIETAIKVEVLT